MKTLLTALITLCLMTWCSTAQAGALGVGGHVSTRTDNAGTTGGLFASVMLGLPTIASWTPNYAEFAYEASGEGARESLTRMGGHWAVLSYPRMDFTLGGGAVVRALGVELTNVGAFGGLGAIVKNSDGEPKYGVSVYGNWSLPDPRPNATFRTFVVDSFEWPF